MHVSRETIMNKMDLTPFSKQECSTYLPDLQPDIIDRFEVYLTLLNKWQRAINLVGKNTLQDAWRRHILDSAQLVTEVDRSNKIVDLGSGAGFPGLVLAIATGAHVQLVESDQRKATFMREVARETNTDVQVHVARIEDLPPLGADIVTARALAPLTKLLPWVYRHLAADGKTVLLKGADVEQELTECGKQWTMKIARKPSVTDDSGTILVINNLLPLIDG